VYFDNVKVPVENLLASENDLMWNQLVSLYLMWKQCPFT
jgi:alkylation response protein AidB-like acyl-CoA dehydrogenase